MDSLVTKTKAWEEEGGFPFVYDGVKMHFCLYFDNGIVVVFLVINNAIIGSDDSSRNIFWTCLTNISYCGTKRKKRSDMLVYVQTPISIAYTYIHKYTYVCMRTCIYPYICLH